MAVSELQSAGLRPDPAGEPFPYNPFRLELLSCFRSLFSSSLLSHVVGRTPYQATLRLRMYEHTLRVPLRIRLSVTNASLVLNLLRLLNRNNIYSIGWLASFLTEVLSHPFLFRDTERPNDQQSCSSQTFQNHSRCENFLASPRLRVSSAKQGWYQVVAPKGADNLPHRDLL